MKIKPSLEVEKQFVKCIGIDEVGRGCLAGPVVTASVILPDEIFDYPIDSTFWAYVDDSKKLTPAKRTWLAELIWKYCEVYVGWCSVEEIDQWNILHASMIAMRRALLPLAGKASVVLVDGHLSPYSPQFRCPEGEAFRLGFSKIQPIVKGDSVSLSIAAASIVAKVYRDQWMTELDSLYPGYFFKNHKGYSTVDHYKALKKLGPCVIHRKSFKLVCRA